MTIKIDNIEAVSKLLTFDNNEQYVMFLVDRALNKGGHKGIYRDSVTSLKSYFKAVDNCLKLIPSELRDYRIYINFNPRCAVKAWLSLSKEVMQSFADGQKYRMLANHHAKFIGELSKPLNKMKTQYFMYDLDTQEEEVETKLREELLKHTSIVTTIPSKRGKHIFVKPFNLNLVKHTEISNKIEFKQDAFTNAYIYDSSIIE